MDSLNTMDVINDIEDYYDVVVNIHYVDWVLTVNDLASLVIEEIKKQP
jgi:acyl carrier protein